MEIGDPDGPQSALSQDNFGDEGEEALVKITGMSNKGDVTETGELKTIREAQHWL